MNRGEEWYSLLVLNLGGDGLCDLVLLVGMGEDTASVFWNEPCFDAYHPLFPSFLCH